MYSLKSFACACVVLVDVAVVAVLIFELLNVFSGGLSREAGLLLDDGMDGGVNILRHAGGIATDVDAGSFLEP
jgi:hypothetical protein